MYELYQNSQQYSHTLTGPFPSSGPQIRKYTASWCARFGQCSVSRPKEIPENYSKAISLEYYLVALGEHRHRFHPVNDLAPYIRQAGGVSLNVQCKTNSNTPDLCLVHLHVSIPSTPSLFTCWRPTLWPPALPLLPALYGRLPSRQSHVFQCTLPPMVTSSIPKSGHLRLVARNTQRPPNKETLCSTVLIGVVVSSTT